MLFTSERFFIVHLDENCDQMPDAIVNESQNPER